jgi:hypothetical protein
LLWTSGNTELNVNNRYTQSATQTDSGSNLDALTRALGQLGSLGRS